MPNETDAYRKGYRAARAGKPLWANPYLVAMAVAWKKGWRAYHRVQLEPAPDVRRRPGPARQPAKPRTPVLVPLSDS